MSAPRRLVYVLPRLYNKGGQERSTLEVLKRLPQDQWQIHVVSFVFEDAPEHFTWHRVAGLKVPTEFLRNLVFALGSWWILRRRFDSSDLVVTIGVASWRADVRVVQFFHHQLAQLVKHGLAVFPNARTWWKRAYQKLYSRWNCFLERRLFARTRQVIAISGTVAADLQRHLDVPAEIILHAPDVTADLKETRSPRETPMILFAGALERKGIEKCLRCLSEVADLPWSFEVIGRGDIPRWQSYAKDLGLEGRVTFHGFQSAPEWFAKAEVFFFPSLYEPFGLVVSEAASNNLAMLVSSECGAMELWPQREEWLKLSATEDDRRWVQALRRVLAESEVRKKISSEAHQSFALWDWQQAADRYHQVFAETAAKH